MSRPLPRDDDALPVLLRTLKNKLAALAGRTTVPVGKGWLLRQDSTGALIAVNGGVVHVLAKPGARPAPDGGEQEPAAEGWLTGTVTGVADDGLGMTVELTGTGESVPGWRYSGWPDPLGVGDLVALLAPGDAQGAFAELYLVLGPVTAPADRVFVNDTPVTIPDADGPGSGFGTPVYSSITVTGISGAAPTDLVVGLTIAHTFPADLTIWLSPPGAPANSTDLPPPTNAPFVLYDGPAGGCGADAPEPTYTIDGSGWPANGEWRLWVSDVAPGDVGQITSWSLTFPA